MFSFNAGHKMPSLKEAKQWWLDDQKGGAIARFLLMNNRILDSPIPDRFIVEENKGLFDNMSATTTDQPNEGIPVQSMIDICFNKLYVNNVDDVDFTLSIKGLDYLNNLETARLVGLQTAAKNLQICESTWNEALENFPRAKAWVESVQAQNVLVEIHYARLWVDLRIWTMAKVLERTPFEQFDVIATLNTLFPPFIDVLPNHHLSKDIIVANRATFFGYLLDVQRNGPDSVTQYIKELNSPANDRSWSKVRTALGGYVKLTESMIKEASKIKDIRNFTRSDDIQSMSDIEEDPFMYDSFTNQNLGQQRAKDVFDDPPPTPWVGLEDDAGRRSFSSDRSTTISAGARSSTNAANSKKTHRDGKERTVSFGKTTVVNETAQKLPNRGYGSPSGTHTDQKELVGRMSMSDDRRPNFSNSFEVHRSPLGPGAKSSPAGGYAASHKSGENLPPKSDMRSRPSAVDTSRSSNSTGRGPGLDQSGYKSPYVTEDISPPSSRAFKNESNFPKFGSDNLPSDPFVAAGVHGHSPVPKTIPSPLRPREPDRPRPPIPQGIMISPTEDAEQYGRFMKRPYANRSEINKQQPHVGAMQIPARASQDGNRGLGLGYQPAMRHVTSLEDIDEKSMTEPLLENDKKSAWPWSKNKKGKTESPVTTEDDGISVDQGENQGMTFGNRSETWGNTTSYNDAESINAGPRFRGVLRKAQSDTSLRSSSSAMGGPMNTGTSSKGRGLSNLQNAPLAMPNSETKEPLPAGSQQPEKSNSSFWKKGKKDKKGKTKKEKALPEEDVQKQHIEFLQKMVLEQEKNERKLRQARARGKAPPETPDKDQSTGLGGQTLTPDGQTTTPGAKTPKSPIERIVGSLFASYSPVG